jgi:hypothetical protein
MERLIPGIDAVAAARRAGAMPRARVETAKTGGVRASKVFAVAAAVAAILLAGVGWRLFSARSGAAPYAVASASEVTVTSALSAPSPKPVEPVQTKPVQLTRSIAPPAAPPPSTSSPAPSVIVGTYLAQAKAGCGAQRQSVRVAINDGRISREHDALDTTFRWEGTIAPDGTIKAAVADRPNLKAAGRYDLDDREVAMSYPQCGTVTMLIGQMLSR